MITDKGLSDSIQLESCHTGSHMFTDLSQCLGYEKCILAHQLYLFFCLGLYHLPKNFYRITFRNVLSGDRSSSVRHNDA